MNPSHRIILAFLCIGLASCAGCELDPPGERQPTAQEQPIDPPSSPEANKERAEQRNEPANHTGDATNLGRVLYQERFDKGPGGWTVGKDKRDGSFNVNVLGQRGDAVPLKWQPTGGPAGGFASSEGPWYFDSNHGEFMWFYLALIGPTGEAWGKHRQTDLRDARLKITVRGHDMQLKDTNLYLWVQGNKGPYISRAIYNPGDPLVNWALVTQTIGDELTDGQWHTKELVLHNNEHHWSQMGLLNRGLPRKIVVEQSLTMATGSLDHLLNGHLYCLGFILGGVDPADPPSGRIDVADITIYAADGQNVTDDKEQK